MSDDRSERLRKQRNRSAEKVKSGRSGNPVKPDRIDKPAKSDSPDKPNGDDPGSPGKPVKPDEPANTDGPDNSEEPDESVTPVKQRDNWGPTQIHLPDRLENQMGLVLDQTNIKMRSDGAEPLEKLMHWYPLVVQEGLDAVAEMDAEEIQEEIAEFEDDHSG